MKKIISFFIAIIPLHMQACTDDAITIFIHGTNIPGVDFKRQLFGDYIPKGLVKAHDMHENIHPHAIIRSLTTGKNPFTAEDVLYFFGWDGIFPIQREHAAQQLHNELIAIVHEKEYTSDNPLHITFITHSHGGNIVLYLINIIEEQKSPIVINTLILMGCPIFNITASYIEKNTVQKIFNLYSDNDRIQILDPQALYPESYLNGKKPDSLFAKRTFDTTKKTVWQAKITIDQYALNHFDWINPKFICSLGQIIKEIETCDPGFLSIDATIKTKPIKHLHIPLEY